MSLTRLGVDRHGFGSRRATIGQSGRSGAESNIIHLHNIHGYYVNIDVLFDYLRRAGKPIV